MLKCCIVYFPGSGGNFLRRVLSLSNDSLVVDPAENISLQEKFKIFNNWKTDNWKKYENQHWPSYRSGITNIVEFENSKLKLVDAWHPEEFYTHDINGYAWEKGKWEHLIFININSQDKIFLTKQQHSKHYSCHWHTEEPAMQKLKTMYPESLEIDFQDFFELNLFKTQIKKVSDYCQLDLDIDLACILWENWYSKSKQIWNI